MRTRMSGGVGALADLTVGWGDPIGLQSAVGFVGRGVNATAVVDHSLHFMIHKLP
jgi:hypothetical protein